MKYLLLVNVFESLDQRFLVLLELEGMAVSLERPQSLGVGIVTDKDDWPLAQ